MVRFAHESADAHDWEYLAEGQCIGGDLLHQVLLLGWGGEVYASLQHAAAVTVGGDLHGISSRGIVDELTLLRAQPLQAALDDMVAVQVPNQGHDTRPEGLYDQLHLQMHCGQTLLLLPRLGGFMQIHGLHVFDTPDQQME